MKKTTLPGLLTLTAILFYQCKKEPVSIDIQDNNFLNSLIEQGIDVDGDRKISPDEAAAVISLNVAEDTISDITGIESFVNLDTLICSSNKIKSLDVSNLTRLVYLDCGRNPLGTLDISKNSELYDLDCENNQLTSLDLSSNSKIYNLNCSKNQITTLDVTPVTDLLVLYVTDMPALFKICVPAIPTGFSIDQTGSPNVYLSSDCS
jgi:Leucine-rich repeat (LRR) protein